MPSFVGVTLKFAYESDFFYKIHHTLVKFQIRRVIVVHAMVVVGVVWGVVWGVECWLIKVPGRVLIKIYSNKDSIRQIFQKVCWEP